MIKLKRYVSIALVLVISIWLLIGCGESINLQTEEEAVEYLKNYIEENKRSEILEDMGYSSYNEMTFLSSSYAQILNEDWFVIIHVKINKEQFSYVAMVSTDGQITEEEIYKDIVYIKREIY